MKWFEDPALRAKVCLITRLSSENVNTENVMKFIKRFLRSNLFQVCMIKPSYRVQEAESSTCSRC